MTPFVSIICCSSSSFHYHHKRFQIRLVKRFKVIMNTRGVHPDYFALNDGYDLETASGFEQDLTYLDEVLSQPGPSSLPATLLQRTASQNETASQNSNDSSMSTWQNLLSGDHEVLSTESVSQQPQLPQPPSDLILPSQSAAKTANRCFKDSSPSEINYRNRQISTDISTDPESLSMI